VEKEKSTTARVLQIALTYAWMIGTAFLGAGRVDWVRGWICVALWVVSLTIVGLLIRRYNPQLMKQRARWRRKDTKGFDKIFLAAYMPFVLTQPAMAGMDAVRFHWSSVPFGYVYVGTVIFVLAMALIAWVLCTNPYAETSVRIQHERGHTVITSGPYRIVRHPMYVGASLMYLSTPLVWGSLWALGVGGIITVLFVVRTALEDRTLLRELAGYEEYAAQTRYRLLPGIW
jgi:protein-S-isoprenylcysteine O-methyltransferase Ste14